MKRKRRKVKRHIKWKILFLYLFIVGLFVSFLFYFFTLKVKNIYIIGNASIKDYEIIEVAGLKEYPKFYRLSKNAIIKKIQTLDLVDKVKVKRNLLGKITIIIEEAHPIFYNTNNSTYVLSNGKETMKKEFLGVPFLDNYVPGDIYERLVKEMAKLKPETIALISEIEYSQSKSGDVVLDDTRFIFYMNDGNTVYINLIHMDRMDLYALTYTTLPQDEKGHLYLDSDNDKVIFQGDESNG